jgi:hypothetical protein
MPTTDQLQGELDALLARVNAIDGTGLSDPTLAVTAVLAAKIAGLQTTIVQSNLTLQKLLNDVRADVASLRAALNTHLGV